MRKSPTKKKPAHIHLTSAKSEYEKQVEHIVDLMVTNRWTPQAARDLATKWNKLSHSSIRERAAEASRRIRWVMESGKDEARAVMLACIQNAMNGAVAAGQYGAVMKGFDLQCRVLGLMAPVEQKVSIEGLSQLSDEEFEQKRQELLAKLAAATPALPPAEEQH